MAKTSLKRLLALVLTVLMIIGAVPMAIFAVGEGAAKESYVAPNAAEITAAGGNVLFYTDFSGSALNGSNVGPGRIDDRAGWSSNPTDGALPIKGRSDSGQININFHALGNKNGVANPDMSGKSFVWSVDIKLGDAITAGTLGTFYCYTATENHNTRQAVDPVKMDANGKVTTKGGAAVVTLSKTEFTNIAIFVDVASNKFNVYVDGNTVVEGESWCTQAQIDTIKAVSGFENGYAISDVALYRNGTADLKNVPAFYFDNYTLYASDSFITNDCQAFEGSPSAIEITKAGGSVLFYTDFSGSGLNDSNVGPGRIDDRAGWSSTPTDGALPIKGRSDSGQININFHALGNKNGVANPDMSGKSFVWSVDIKLGDAITAGTLGTFVCYTATEEHTTKQSVDALKMDANGKVTTKGGAAVVTLSKTEYTNIAIFVDVASNKFNVYVDGRLTVYGESWCTQTQIDTIKAVSGFENGYAISVVSLYRNGTADLKNVPAFYFDNYTLYASDAYIKKGSGVDPDKVYDRAPSAAEIQTAGGTVLFYTDFSGSGLNDSNVGTGRIDDRAGWSSNPTDGALPIKGRSDSGQININFHALGNKNGVANPDMSGKSFVWSVDIKLGDAITAGTLGTFYCYTATENHNTRQAVDPVKMDANGKVTTKGGAAVVTLSKTEYTNIAIFVNVKSNYFNVYVNGEPVVVCEGWCTQTQIDTIKAVSGFENGYAISDVALYRNGAADIKNVPAFYFDNYTIYANDSYIPAITKDADRVLDSMGNGYVTLEEAIESTTSGTLTLLRNVEAGDIYIENDISLDLNGKALTADSIVIGADNFMLYDSGDTKGAIKCENIAWTNANAALVYNSKVKGYEVYYVDFQKKAPAVSAESGKLEFTFRPSLGSKAINESVFGTEGNVHNTLFFVNIDAYKDGQIVESNNYMISEQTVYKAYSENKAFNIQISGFEGYDSIVITYIMETNDAAYVTSTNIVGAVTYTAPAAE